MPERRAHSKRPATAAPMVTRGLKWAPDTCPTAYAIVITVRPNASATPRNRYRAGRSGPPPRWGRGTSRAKMALRSHRRPARGAEGLGAQPRAHGRSAHHVSIPLWAGRRPRAPHSRARGRVRARECCGSSSAGGGRRLEAAGPSAFGQVRGAGPGGNGGHWRSGEVGTEAFWGVQEWPRGGPRVTRGWSQGPGNGATVEPSPNASALDPAGSSLRSAGFDAQVAKRVN